MGLNKFTIQESFAISAGAGSGKTYILSRRYINALLGFDYFREDYKTQKDYFSTLKPAKVNQIVTITYTEAAALEMKGRIFELVLKIINPNLSKNDKDYISIQDANTNISLAQQKYVQETLKLAYVDSSNSKISTIHAYCLDIIKSNADIARIDTKLDIIKDDEKKKELATIIFDVLNDKANEALILDISHEISMFFIDNLIDKYVSNSKFRKDYDSFCISSIDTNTYKKLILELYPLPKITDDLLNEIYFSEAKEDEAFFKSNNTKSIEICSIHSTKGLAYPLVLLANSDKTLYSQITSDALKHNNFTLNKEKKEIVGFKINDYTPLSHRVLKAIDKLKHLAEKKRLLYVALTRAEHDVVISAQLKAKKEGGISLREDSYLHMICSALDINILNFRT